MFWGLIIQSNKRYSQKISKTFHLSHAVLDTTSVTGSNTDVQVWLVSENQNYLLCTLNNDTVKQVALDLVISAGDEIAFYSVGGTVHLTGYLQEDFDMDEGLDEEESDEEEAIEAPQKDSKAKKLKANEKKQKAKVEEESDDSDIDNLLNGLEESDDEASDDDDDEELESDDDDDEDEEDDSEDDEEEVKSPPIKKQKTETKPAKQNGMEASSSKKNKKEQKKQEKEKQQQQPQQQQQQKQKQKQQQQQPEQQKKPEKQKTLQGGVQVQELRVGKGTEAKSGKQVQVYYEGRLKQNNKIFDSTKSGQGFKFLLGRGEVIRGWDIGVSGMKVGGKRRIVCPADMAYGAKGSPPVIPPNSTLVFDVELRGVN